MLKSLLENEARSFINGAGDTSEYYGRKDFDLGFGNTLTMEFEEEDHHGLHVRIFSESAPSEGIVRVVDGTREGMKQNSLNCLHSFLVSNKAKLLALEESEFDDVDMGGVYE